MSRGSTPGSGPPADRIRLRGIRVPARVGVLPGEADREQDLLIDLTAHLDLERASASDDLADTLDYAELAERVAGLVRGRRWNLIESVAGRVAELVLEDDRVRVVQVTVHKPGALSEVEDVSVTVERGR